MKIMFSLLIVMSLIFVGCCSKDNPENISNGTVVDENTIAETDSLAQILQTWVPEVPVDSVTFMWRDEFCTISGDSLYYSWNLFTTEEKRINDYIEDTDACVIRIYERELGVNFTKVHCTDVTDYSKILYVDSCGAVEVNNIVGLYTGVDSPRCLSNLEVFRQRCEDVNGVFKDALGGCSTGALLLRCSVRIEPTMRAIDYLNNAANNLIQYCGDMVK